MTTCIVTVNIVDLQDSLTYNLPHPLDTFILFHFYGMQPPIYLGTENLLFPWSIRKEIASFIGKTSDGSGISIRFHIDLEGKEIPT